MTTPQSPTPTTRTPPPELRWMYCDSCETYVIHARTPSGEWLCGQGHNATMLLEREMQLSADVGAAIRTFLGMTQEERIKWGAIFFAELGPAAQDMGEVQL